MRHPSNYELYVEETAVLCVKNRFDGLFSKFTKLFIFLLIN